ncbi:P-type conjugative transfer protein TrbJ [Halodesulfovibrio marinisediminis]|uniref:P-type conjugative transfer protein TrbJ n=1 Tax=Halodesulfovibrio marinisediminis DSM 17456 TaxID=1121457 RepID=A0A1N6FF59_9BACT|nr:P-type conjugative transfer protein TrbJ [Halodesulfovibrio marinisediminis]SIN93895.1 P-type conjugative transfer protein TrbJ [Halodesulfovibrio marinisediminis DSM 17456]
MRSTTFLIIALLLSIISFSQAHARTVYCTNCSNNFVQLLDRVTNMNQLKALWKEYGESVQQTAQQIRMVQQNIEQYANMVHNTVSLPVNTMNRMVGDFNRLSGYVERISARTGEINTMKDLYNTFYAKQSALRGVVRTAEGTKNYSDMWDRWSGEVDRAAEATFKLTGNQLADLRENGELEAHIRDLLSTPKGRMEAIQAGNKLAAIQIKEAQETRALMATYLQQEMAKTQKREKIEQVQEEARRSLFNPNPESYFSAPQKPVTSNNF